MYKKTRVILDWSIAISCYLATLLIIPLSNYFLPNLGESTVDAVWNLFINIIIAAVFIILLAVLVSRGEKASLSSYISLAVIFGLGIFFLAHIQASHDRLHFLGYGILSLLLWRALRHSIATYMLYFWALLAVMIFACLDELLQLSGAGGRNFSFADIRTDWFSALLAQLLIALVFRPKLEVAAVKINYLLRKLSQARDFQSKFGRK